MKTKVFLVTRMAAAAMAAYLLAALPHSGHKSAFSSMLGLYKGHAAHLGKAYADTRTAPEMTLEEFCTAFAVMQEERFARSFGNRHAR